MPLVVLPVVPTVSRQSSDTMYIYILYFTYIYIYIHTYYIYTQIHKYMYIYIRKSMVCGGLHGCQPGMLRSYLRLPWTTGPSALSRALSRGLQRRRLLSGSRVCYGLHLYYKYIGIRRCLLYYSFVGTQRGYYDEDYDSYQASIFVKIPTYS